MIEMARLRRVVRVAAARIAGARRGLTMGRGSQVKGRLIHNGSGTVVFGEDCRIGMGVRTGTLVVSGPGRVTIGARCRIDAAEIYTLDDSASITIGDDCYLNRVEIAASQSITIGQRCEIGSALIYDTDFHSAQRAPRGEVRSGPIVIGDDVWIAARTAVLRGARIGDRCVIGLGVTVTGTVDADTLVRPALPRRDPLERPGGAG